MAAQAWDGDDKRTLVHLRRIIDKAPPIEKATLRMLARMLTVEQLRPLDATLGRISGGRKPEHPPW